ncbi:MAG: PDZ domain-containing protein [Eubacteriales bacterium]
MAEVFSFASLILGQLWKAIFENVVFWVVLALVAVQYRKIAKTRESMFGIRGNTVLKDTLTATLFGVIGGVVGSFVLVITGINLTGIGISYLWPLALLLMLINPRFLCFSYAGGIIALSNLLFGVPRIDIPQLMGLIAILHLVESLLISFSGHAGATPMFTKNPKGQLVGGFTLQKFWPLPIVAIAFLPGVTGFALLPQMPDWWPVIKFGHGLVPGLQAVIIPFVAGLGYGDLALAHTPVEKSKMSARNLSVFSLILLVLALLASRYRILEYLAAVFAPLGHEAVIYLGQNTEMKGRPIFVPPMRGVRVLEAVPNTAAQAAGVRSGDVILAINGVAVSSKRDIETIIWGRPQTLEIEYVTYTRKKWQRAFIKLRPHQPLGIIAVPEGFETVYTEFGSQSLISRLIQKFSKQ